MARTAYVIADKKVLVFCSWKAGSTSMADWLADVLEIGYAPRRPDLSPSVIERHKRRALEAAIPVTEPAESLRLIREDGFTDFVMTRNPYRRAVSAFVEKFVFYENQRGPLTSLSSLKGFSRKAFLGEMERQGRSSDESDYEGDDFAGLSFVEFLQYIRHKAQNPSDATGEPDLNRHWNLQVPYCFDREDFNYSNVIRLERAAEDIVPLTQALKTDVPFPHSRRQKAEGFSVVSDQDLSGAKSVHLIGARTIPSAKALLNEETIALIREAYEIDFRKLGYRLDDY
jgi:hypothetical protein